VTDTIVVEQTGESFDSPSDYLMHQRRLEREIQRFDDAIAVFKADLSSSKKQREKAVGELRTLIREAKIAARASRKKAAK
jgi:hypothetical protein